MTELAVSKPLTEAEFARLQHLARWSGRWGRTRRGRRLLFLGLAAPGFFCVFATPRHQNLAVLAVGFTLFAAACLCRAQSEPIFARAEAANLWPPPDTSSQSESSHGP